MTDAISFLTFCVQVLRLSLTPAWRVMIKVAIDGVEPRALDAVEREIAHELFGPVEDVPAFARRLLVWILGRESWKTTIASALALFTLLTANIAGAGPGDVPTFMVIAPDKKTALLSIRIALDLAKSVPVIARCIVSETADGFTLRRPTDGRTVAFECFVVSRAGANLRGRSILGAILDESMFFTSDAEGDYVKNDRDVYRAIVPRLMKGGRILFISTPWPVETLTGELFVLNHGHPITAIAARASTLTMRDNDPEVAERIAIERATDPIDTARERDADMTALAGAGLLFDPAAVDRCVVADAPIEIPLPSEPFAIGVGMDLAFRSDASAIAIVGRIDREFVLLSTEEIRPKPGEPLKPSAVIASFATRMHRYGARIAYADSHCIDPVREFLSDQNIHLLEAPGGAPGKQETHVFARAVIHEGRLGMPRVAGAIAQLKGIRSRPAPGGGLTIWSPRRKGSHGDLASAIVLAIYAASQTGMPMADGRAVDQFGGPRWGRAPRDQRPAHKTQAQHDAVHGAAANNYGRPKWAF